MITEILIKVLENDCKKDGMLNCASLCGTLQGTLITLAIDLEVMFPDAYKHLEEKFTKRILLSLKEKYE